jgi:hypothetical protein
VNATRMLKSFPKYDGEVVMNENEESKFKNKRIQQCAMMSLKNSLEILR